MNHEEYLQKREKLESEFSNKKLQLMKDFVNANNPYKIGDRITDRSGTILIEHINASWGWLREIPYAVYTGTLIEKDGTKNKKGIVRQVAQPNIIKS